MFIDILHDINPYNDIHITVVLLLFDIFHYPGPWTAFEIEKIQLDVENR